MTTLILEPSRVIAFTESDRLAHVAALDEAINALTEKIGASYAQYEDIMQNRDADDVPPEAKEHLTDQRLLVARRFVLYELLMSLS
jgi:hypothetical protein